MEDIFYIILDIFEAVLPKKFKNWFNSRTKPVKYTVGCILFLIVLIIACVLVIVISERLGIGSI